MAISIRVEYELPRWPNYLLQKITIGSRQQGFAEPPKIDVGELDSEMVDMLCDDFRRHCQKRGSIAKGNP